MKPVKLFFSVIVLSISSVHGQSKILNIVNTSGGSTRNGGYTVEWNIGELSVVNEMVSGNGNSILTNGFIQPLPTDNIPFTGPASNPLEFASSNVHIFPNPTHDLVAIDFSQAVYKKVIIQLSDELGNILYSREIPVYAPGTVERINMKGFTKGSYRLYIKKLNPASGQYDLETDSYTIIKL
jgi:hypothetical protein